jgi:glutamate synthase (NADPH/NADH) small chain
LEYPRVDVAHRPVAERLRDYGELDLPHADDQLRQQAARCMDCGVPFCHGAGCPVKNRIPEFNELVYRNRWREASENLHSTNNFPEITGRVCPAPCEAACTLRFNDDAVLIKHIEYQIAERAFAEGWVRPLRPAARTGKRAAIVGSGPAGLAAAQQLARMGHEVVVFEKDDRIGGLLRYGIPDFKLEKRILDRRIEQMVAEGVRFEPGAHVGRDVSLRYLLGRFNAVGLMVGAGEPRRLNVPGDGFENVVQAMEFLTHQNRRVAAGGDAPPPNPRLSARNKVVVVIGGGDTGSDCVGTSLRQGAKEVHQFEILPKPPEGTNPATPWPLWPHILRTSTSHEEGCTRRFSTLTQGFTGNGLVANELYGCEVDWSRSAKGWEYAERPGSEFRMKVDLVLLALGFLHVEHHGLVEELGLELDARGNVSVKDSMTSHPGVFAAGDAARGASLVVHAIYAGRESAAAIHRWMTSGTA